MLMCILIDCTRPTLSITATIAWQMLVIEIAKLIIENYYYSTTSPVQ
jgi:hypothetical protein